MAEIKIKTDNLNMEIGNLRALGQKINASNIKCPGVVGGGSSVQEVENIGRIYQTIHAQLAALVLNTVSFMENVNTSYQSSDNKASGGFK